MKFQLHLELCEVLSLCEVLILCEVPSPCEVLSLCEVPSPCEVLILTPPAAAQGSCRCCTHRTRLGFATCKSALVLVAGLRPFKNQFLPRKKTPADFNHHHWHCRGVIAKTAWDWSLFISVGTIPACVCAGVQGSTCCCLLSSRC